MLRLNGNDIVDKTVTVMILSPAGGSGDLNDVHDRPANRVCGHGSNIHRPAQPQCQGSRPRSSQVDQTTIRQSITEAILQKINNTSLEKEAQHRGFPHASYVNDDCETT